MYDDSTLSRFWAKVDVRGPDDCWPWLACLNEKGYGLFRANGRNVRSHRFSFFIHHGYWPEPEGLHTCDNPPCCNPIHIIAGTHADNMQDMARKGRANRTPRRVGSQVTTSRFTEDDVRLIRSLYKSGVKQVHIADMFGVRQGHISNIITRRMWAHVD